MDRIEKWFEDKMHAPWGHQPPVPIAYEYVKTGDRSVLRQIKPLSTGHYYWDIADAIASPRSLSDSDRRALHVMAALGLWQFVGEWLDKHLVREAASEDYHGVLTSELARVGFDRLSPTTVTVPWVQNLAVGSRPTSAGRYLLSLSDRGLRQLARDAANDWYSCHAMLDFMLLFAHKRVQLMLGDLLRPKETIRLPQTCRILLEKGGGAYDRDVLVAFRQTRDTYSKLLAGVELDKHNHSVYGREVLQAARASLAGNDSGNRHDVVCEWMVDAYGREVVPEIADYIRRTHNTTGHAKQFVIPHCVSVLGKEALPIVLAGLDTGGPNTPFVALTHLVEIGDDGHQAIIRERIEAGLRQQDTGRIIRYIALAGRWNPSAVSETLWALAENDSKPVREAAARALGRMGDDAVERAAKLLEHRKADIRLVAVTTLAAIGTVSALRAMEDRLDVDDNDDVREAILAALQEAWQSAGKALTREDVEARAQKSAARVKWPPATWLASFSLPSIGYAGGEPAPEHIVRYLLWRQSRGQDIRSPHELKPLYDLIDRATSGDFALTLLNEYIASGADAKDKWALASAALLGDDRIVPVLTAQVKDWVDRGRGKLAEYAVQALALLATDRALLAIDSIAMRYRAKMKNVGAAASEAFVSAAESLGISPEELGDKVVPWLGFEPGKPREIACGGRTVTARIGLDFKLRYHDVEKNKRVASLPSSASEETRAEFKDLSGLLREVSKSQIRRMETLMVQQRRWSAEDWQALFLKHPLMIPFGVRLVWGAYDYPGSLVATFRALEDQTLTDNADAAVELADGWTIGIVHPLELTQQTRQDWNTHLADYEIQSPFAQLERPVVSAKREQAGLKYYKDLSGSELNGMTFKGRAERLGWRRGSVCDGGWISTYMKSFPNGGVDVFLCLEDMFVGIDMYSDIKLGDAFFVSAGSVKIGSYVYDEPEKSSDPRLLEFGQVPPIVFSEVMADLQRIAGGKQEKGE